MIAGLLFSRGAVAAEPTFRFNIVAEPLSLALMDFASQTGSSMDTSSLGDCATLERSLRGQFSRTEAIGRLLAGSDCEVRVLDATTFSIAERPHKQSGPAPRKVAVEPPTDVAGLIVTALPWSAPDGQKAASATVLASRYLLDQAATGAADLALLAPAMTVTNLGAGRDKILLRGLSDGPLTGQAQSMVGLYLDDVRLTYNAPDPDLRLVDVDHVTVLRGPQGAQYGAGSIGGVVQMASASPDRSRFGGWVDIDFGETEGGGLSRAEDVVVNAPLSHQHAAARLVLYDEADAGYVRDTALGASRANTTERQGGRLVVDVDASDRWTLSAGVVAQAINTADTQYAMLGQPYLSRDTQVREPHDNDFAEYRLGARGDLGWAQLRWTTGLVRHSLTSRYDATTDPPMALPPGPAAFDTTNVIESLVTEIGLSSNRPAHVQWVAGAFLAHTNNFTLSDLAVLTTPATVALSEARHDRTTEAALFGEAAVPLTPRLGLTLGGRAYVNQTAVFSTGAAPLLSAQARFSQRLIGKGFAPKLSLSYRTWTWMEAYLLASEGYRTGGFNTAGGPLQVYGPAGGSAPARSYSGDELWNLEAGAKLGLQDGRVLLRGAIFDAFWRNLQSDQLLPSGLPFTANIGNARNMGVELEGQFRAERLELHGQMIANSPEVVHASSAAFMSDLGLSAVPNVAYGATARYGWALGQGFGLDLDGRWNFIGRSQVALNGGAPQVMDSYSVGRVAASLARANWRISLAIDNISGSRGDTFAFGNPFTFRDKRQITPLRPRTVSMILRAAY